MFTDGERDQIRAAMRLKNAMAPAPVAVRVVNHPSPPPEVKFPDINFPKITFPEIPDPKDELAKIAAVIGGLKGHTIAKAIEGLAGTPKTIEALTGQVLALTAAVKAIKTPDMTPIAEAIAANTKALRNLAKVMSAPKSLVFDEADDTRPVGIETHVG